MTKKVHVLKLHLSKDDPLRKPTPVYFGLARESRDGSICGCYIRIGTRCRCLLVR